VASLKMQDYEESVLFLGSWGPFQRRIFFVLCLTCVPCGYNILSVIFLLASPPHHCDIPPHSNLSQEREGCRDGWSYSTEYFQSTVVTEFDLVCSEQWKQPLTSLVYFLGGLSGCFISGLISDRFGRKPVLFGSIAILSIFSSAVAFAPSWPVFTVLFFMLGLGQISCYIVVFVLGSEILVGSSRILFSSLGQPFVYSFSMMLLPGTAYLVRSWRHLSLIMAVPGLACIPLWWLVPESPRWLLSRGRLQEAELLLRSAALENRVEAPPVIFLPPKAEKAEAHQAESVSFLDLVKTAKIRHITLKLWLIWFSTSVSYFGLSFSMSTLYGNLFLNYFLLTAVELPAYFASWLAARSSPRRLSFIGFCLLGALALLFIQVATNCYPTLTMSLVLLGKFGVLAGSGVVYTYTGELSPTVIRNTAMSSCAMFSRVGSSVSPYLLELGETFKSLQLLPWITLGVLSLLAVLLCIFLPETFQQPLPDTIEQMPVTQCCRWWAGGRRDDGGLHPQPPQYVAAECRSLCRWVGLKRAEPRRVGPSHAAGRLQERRPR
uniref:Major facilitator superfamily (MFS) profile domain-containing protein n=1 Tax=Poecilia mexicana TaxID=48701 RepID=A0A3B3X2P7_9TELE